jgi:AraC-like DNA-binding protein
MPKPIRPRPGGLKAADGTDESSPFLADVQKALATLPILQRVDTIAVGDIWGSSFHSTPAHEMIHVLEGRARIEFQQHSFDVGPGDTFVIPQGTQHRDVRGADANYRVIYVFFHWPGADAIVRQIDPLAITRAPEGVKPHLHLMLKELEHDYLSDDPQAPERIRLLLLEILVALLRYCRRGDAPPGDARQALARERRGKLAAGVKAYLNAHAAEVISLEQLAEAHGVSPFHLSRSFSQEFAISITEMLTMIRVERAAELLRTGGLSVKEIAAAAGFSDSNYFAKVFRRSKGISPTEFQSRLKKK